MYVYVFQGAEDFLGFAAHSDGLNLPAANGPWVLVNRLIISEGDDDRPMVQTRECLRDISTYGYHVTQGRRRVTDTFQH
jgi:hypothetical protein